MSACEGVKVIWAIAFYWIVCGVATYFWLEGFEGFDWIVTSLIVGGVFVPAHLIAKVMR